MPSLWVKRAQHRISRTVYGRAGKTCIVISSVCPSNESANMPSVCSVWK